MRDVDAEPILRVVDLHVEVSTSQGTVEVVRGVSFEIWPGETLGIVGESGAGKSITAWSVLGLLPGNARISGGEIWFKGERLDTAPAKRLLEIRGSEIGTILQDPTAALDPCMQVGAQVEEPLRLHGDGRRDFGPRVVELLDMVGIVDPEERRRAFPHEFSGGMQQRVVGAAAIACDPALLIADEPTTALDVSVQAGYLKVLKSMQARTGAAMLFISHDLGVVSHVSDRVVVLYAGRVAETAPTTTIFGEAHHPYTIGLLNCLPRVGQKSRIVPIPGQPPDPAHFPAGCAFAPRCPLAEARCEEKEPSLEKTADDEGAVRCWRAGDSAALRNPAGVAAVGPAGAAVATSGPPVLELDGVSKMFARPRMFGPTQKTYAVSNVSMVAGPGRTVGIVGETGSGKTTTLRMLLGLERPTSGAVRFKGDDVWKLSRAQRKELRLTVQAVMQNPFSSFDPRMSVAQSVAEPLRELKKELDAEERNARVAWALELVGLRGDHAARAYPHNLSGGQLQRAAIARAMVTDPGCLVLDEPVSALDVSIKAQVLNLLEEIQQKSGVGIVMVSHDLGAVQQLCEEVVVLYRGEVVEQGKTDDVYANPTHPYTRQLVGDSWLDPVPTP